MTLKLHHLNASRSERIIWLLEELGCDYDIIAYQRNKETHLAPPELLAVHPLGKAPLLEVDGRIIAETGAITTYLLSRYDKDYALHPREDDEDYPVFLEWLHAAEGAVFLPHLISFYLSSSNLGESPLAQMMAGEAKKALAHMEAHLSTYPFFGGQRFSAADCLMGFNMNGLEATGRLTDRPAMLKWLETVRTRPAYARMLEKGA